MAGLLPGFKLIKALFLHICIVFFEILLELDEIVFSLVGLCFDLAGYVLLDSDSHVLEVVPAFFDCKCPLQIVVFVYALLFEPLQTLLNHV